jgi:hypothetical protein
MCIAPKRNPVSTLAALNRLAVKPDFAASANANKRTLMLATCQKQIKKTSRAMKRHITVQHNYHDHAADICGDNRGHVRARGGVVTPFPIKLHAMLDAVETDRLDDIVSWQTHGRCFVVHDQKQFVSILMKYFNISKVSSFQRQLNLYGFQRLTKGQDKGGYYHELFLRAKVFLSHSIQRIKVKGTKIRARSNPAQEPNFYALPWVTEQGNNTTSANNSVTVAPVAPIVPSAPPQDSSLDTLVDISPDLWQILPGEKPLERIPASIWDEEDDVLIACSDADAFLQDFDFPSESNAFENIENDAVFGHLLEQMIA